MRTSAAVALAVLATAALEQVDYCYYCSAEEVSLQMNPRRFLAEVYFPERLQHYTCASDHHHELWKRWTAPTASSSASPESSGSRTPPTPTATESSVVERLIPLTEELLQCYQGLHEFTTGLITWDKSKDPSIGGVPDVLLPFLTKTMTNSSSSFCLWGCAELLLLAATQLNEEQLEELGRETDLLQFLPLHNPEVRAAVRQLIGQLFGRFAEFDFTEEPAMFEEERRAFGGSASPVAESVFGILGARGIGEGNSGVTEKKRFRNLFAEFFLPSSLVTRGTIIGDGGGGVGGGSGNGKEYAAVYENAARKMNWIYGDLSLRLPDSNGADEAENVNVESDLPMRGDVEAGFEAEYPCGDPFSNHDFCRCMFAGPAGFSSSESSADEKNVKKAALRRQILDEEAEVVGQDTTLQEAQRQTQEPSDGENYSDEGPEDAPPAAARTDSRTSASPNNSEQSDSASTFTQQHAICRVHDIRHQSLFSMLPITTDDFEADVAKILNDYQTTSDLVPSSAPRPERTSRHTLDLPAAFTGTEPQNAEEMDALPFAVNPQVVVDVKLGGQKIKIFVHKPIKLDALTYVFQDCHLYDQSGCWDQDALVPMTVLEKQRRQESWRWEVENYGAKNSGNYAGGSRGVGEDPHSQSVLAHLRPPDAVNLKRGTTLRVFRNKYEVRASDTTSTSTSLYDVYLRRSHPPVQDEQRRVGYNFVGFGMHTPGLTTIANALSLSAEFYFDMRLDWRLEGNVYMCESLEGRRTPRPGDGVVQRGQSKIDFGGGQAQVGGGGNGKQEAETNASPFSRVLENYEAGLRDEKAAGELVNPACFGKVNVNHSTKTKGTALTPAQAFVHFWARSFDRRDLFADEDQEGRLTFEDVALELRSLLSATASGEKSHFRAEKSVDAVLCVDWVVGCLLLAAAMGEDLDGKIDSSASEKGNYGSNYYLPLLMVNGIGLLEFTPQPFHAKVLKYVREYLWARPATILATAHEQLNPLFRYQTNGVHFTLMPFGFGLAVFEEGAEPQQEQEGSGGPTKKGTALVHPMEALFPARKPLYHRAGGLQPQPPAIKYTSATATAKIIVLRAPFFHRKEGFFFKALAERLHPLAEFTWMNPELNINAREPEHQQSESIHQKTSTDNEDLVNADKPSGVNKEFSNARKWTSFAEITNSDLAVYFPSEVSLMKFKDVYSMARDQRCCGVPIAVPDFVFANRVMMPNSAQISAPETSIPAVDNDSYRLQHPFVPDDNGPFYKAGTDTFEKLLFWNRLADAERMPYVLRFKSVAELLLLVKDESLLLHTSNKMRGYFFGRIVPNVLALYRNAFAVLATCGDGERVFLRSPSKSDPPEGAPYFSLFRRVRAHHDHQAPPHDHEEDDGGRSLEPVAGQLLADLFDPLVGSRGQPRVREFCEGAKDWGRCALLRARLLTSSGG